MEINEKIISRFVEKFLKKSENSYNETPCFEWISSKNKQGYGYFRINNKMEKAHRVSWEIFIGKIPEKMFVLHHCDNPSCVNPDHLFVGNQSDNMIDRHAKGRGNYNPYIGKKNNADKMNYKREDDNPRSKLKKCDVFEILKLLKNGVSRKEIAKMFHVCRQTIDNMANKKGWTKTINEYNDIYS